MVKHSSPNWVKRIKSILFGEEIEDLILFGEETEDLLYMKSNEYFQAMNYCAISAVPASW